MSANELRPVTITPDEIAACDLPGCIEILEASFNWGTANILRKIIKDSKPPISEPGLWGVVEASVQFSDGKGIRSHWVRGTDGHWHSQESMSATWADLTNPVLIREGVDS